MLAHITSQAIISTGLGTEFAGCLKRAHDYVEQSQVCGTGAGARWTLLWRCRGAAVALLCRCCDCCAGAAIAVWVPAVAGPTCACISTVLLPLRCPTAPIAAGY